MFTATAFAIFFVPVFFVLVMRYFTKYVPPEQKQKLAERVNHQSEENMREITKDDP